MNLWTRWSFFFILSSLMAVPTTAQTLPQWNPTVLRPTASSIPIDQGYLLGAGDKIKLDVFSVPEYSGEYQVLADGTLNLPLAGSVVVQDMSLKDASVAISRMFRELLVRPIVTVNLLVARPVNVAVSGEVARPGSYTTTLTEAGIPTLTKMLQLAGGMSQSADLQRVQVVRRSSRGGIVQTRMVDLRQLLRMGDISQDLPLRDGDSIIVPAAIAVNVDDANLIGSSSFAISTDQPLRIIVTGEVNRPGPHSIKSETVPQAQMSSTTPMVRNKVQAPTVTRSLQIAGGITQSANIRDIEVRRRTNAGSEQVLKVNLFELLQAGDSRQDVPLQDGDLVIVPTATTLSPADAATLARASFSPDSISVNVVGEVSRPGLVQLLPNTTLNQALLAAGGFNTRAKRREVSFLRLNLNGTVDRRDIAINFEQGINEESNPPLRNNDTIVVGRSELAGIGDTFGSVFSPLSNFFGIFNFFRQLGK